MTPTQAKARREKIRTSAAEVYRNSSQLWTGLVKCSSDELITMGYDPQQIQELVHVSVPFMKRLAESMQTGAVPKKGKEG
jgi:hypothetical protein